MMTPNNRRAWLDGLKVGDFVTIVRSEQDRPIRTRVAIWWATKTTVEARVSPRESAVFRRSDGARRPYGKWSFNLWRIEPCE